MTCTHEALGFMTATHKTRHDGKCLLSLSRDRGQEDQKFKVLLGCLRPEFKAAWNQPGHFLSAFIVLKSCWGEKSSTVLPKSRPDMLGQDAPTGAREAVDPRPDPQEGMEAWY